MCTTAYMGYVTVLVFLLMVRLALLNRPAFQTMKALAVEGPGRQTVKWLDSTGAVLCSSELFFPPERTSIPNLAATRWFVLLSN